MLHRLWLYAPKYSKYSLKPQKSIKGLARYFSSEQGLFYACTLFLNNQSFAIVFSIQNKYLVNIYMYKPSSLYSLVFIIYGCILSTTSWAEATEPKFDDSFYMSKICTAYMSKDDHEYCDDGYILKSETLNNGEVIETVLMDGLGGYGWNHTSLKKIDKDTYHVYIGCGSPCGTNILLGRGDKKQNFDLYFVFDMKSRCSVEYDNDKSLWVARRFFSDRKITLPSTHGTNDSAVYPNYNVEFDKKGHLIVKKHFSDEVIKTLPNPCSSNQKPHK